jgi:hypothetical protein
MRFDLTVTSYSHLISPKSRTTDRAGRARAPGPARALGDAKNKTPALPVFSGGVQNKKPALPFFSVGAQNKTLPASPVSRAVIRKPHPPYSVSRAVPTKERQASTEKSQNRTITQCPS